jgi:DNA-binding response OmpR family regulator
VLDGRKRPKLAALTDWGQLDDRERAMQAGFDVHLTKPVSHEALRELLQELLRIGGGGNGSSAQGAGETNPDLAPELVYFSILGW